MREGTGTAGWALQGWALQGWALQGWALQGLDVLHDGALQKELREDYAGYKKKVARCVARSLEE